MGRTLKANPPPQTVKYRKELGDHIKSERLLMKLKQHEMAELIGISPTEIAQYEAGLRAMSIEVLDAITNLMANHYKQRVFQKISLLSTPSASNAA